MRCIRVLYNFILFPTASCFILPLRQVMLGMDLGERSRPLQSLVTPVDGPRTEMHSEVPISPYNIIEPLFQETEGELVEKPLFAALHAMQEAMRAIIDGKSALDEPSSAFSLAKRIIRIEHLLSHSVDPLCWLHAQTRGARLLDQPSLFFANADRTLETAVYGSALTHDGIANETFWRMASDLPRGSNFYGAERFDPATKPSEEWSRFGEGKWMLPLIELRRQEVAVQHNAKETQSQSVLAIHIVKSSLGDWKEAARETLSVLRRLTDSVADPEPPTYLPPIISRDSSYEFGIDGQEAYEDGVRAALDEISSGRMRKVVLARRSVLVFDKRARFSALDLLLKWKFGEFDESCHLFYMFPGLHGGQIREFVGCSPEQLFRITNGTVFSEAVAGTRPRGATSEADVELREELYSSSKDREENEITADFISEQFIRASRQGLTTGISEKERGAFFIRRLRHLQHICRSFVCNVQTGVDTLDVARFLLPRLSPTPAVCGFPRRNSMQFIRRMETIAFDRGLYAGPFGYLGTDRSEIVVAIRSGLLSRQAKGPGPVSLSLYAGAGVVPGSTVQAEWAETSYKLNVIASSFPQSPMTLAGVGTPNVAWTTSFIEELVRCGVTQFYVCPGSRSTPFVVALSKTIRSNFGVVNGLSVHDERVAGFRCLGYGRARGKPAAVVTSSGTAISNLYPAIMEAAMDGIPMIVLTADRPYENRDVGANQSVDQVKAFSSSYIRWFRDIPPPNDEVPISLALADAHHAVTTARSSRGPVHVNVQFRENLAPDIGQIRNDPRVDSVVKFNGYRFTDVPGYHRWANVGGPWIQSGFRHSEGYSSADVQELIELVTASTRGIIVVGNLRTSTSSEVHSLETQMAVISHFARTVGFPIIAGAQAAPLRFACEAVICFAEHILKSSEVADNLQPDLIIQIGHPLVASEVANFIATSMRLDAKGLCVSHVLIHPHHPTERADPTLSLTHRYSTDVNPFLASVTRRLDDAGVLVSSQLAPLVLLGRRLATAMPSIIHRASIEVNERFVRPHETTLTEPQVVLAMSEVLAVQSCARSLFLSNSMPVRDAEYFLYPTKDSFQRGRLCDTIVGMNRGASGIDGIVASAVGFMEATGNPTTLLVGDLAALHDLGAFHSLASRSPISNHTKSEPRLTTIVVNNNGGGIFSFLPIAKHGKEVNFEEFFGTPTRSFSFEGGMRAFGLHACRATDYANFSSQYETAISCGDSSVLEALVVDRQTNVLVHGEIAKRARNFVSEICGEQAISPSSSVLEPLPFTILRPCKSVEDHLNANAQGTCKRLLLLHGWLGSATDWNDVAMEWKTSLPGWSIIAVDLPGHGESASIESSTEERLKSMLRRSRREDVDLSVDAVAFHVLNSLEYHNITSIDGLAGYSWGGRVALRMMQLSSSISDGPVNEKTKLMLLGSFPGHLPEVQTDVTSTFLRKTSGLNDVRENKDVQLATKMRALADKSLVVPTRSQATDLLWLDFAKKWYLAEPWGQLAVRKPSLMKALVARRAKMLSRRSVDMAAILECCSVGRNSFLEWKAVNGETTLFIAGKLDEKYHELGRRWADKKNGPHFVSIESAGHALLVDSPKQVAESIETFLQDRQALEQSYELDAIRTGALVMTEFTENEGAEDKAKLAHNEDSSTTSALFDFVSFDIDMVESQGAAVAGIGWGDQARAEDSSRVKRRSGFVIEILSTDRTTVGIGEVSPLEGLHEETLSAVEEELTMIKTHFEHGVAIPLPRPEAIFELDGGLQRYISCLVEHLHLPPLSSPVRAGFEMAILSFASHMQGDPLLLALSKKCRTKPKQSLALNGLVTRARSNQQGRLMDKSSLLANSLKVKVGHQTIDEDISSLASALQNVGNNGGKVRADANQAWTMEEALEFSSRVTQLKGMAPSLEFVEEPLRQVGDSWSIAVQLDALEQWHSISGIKYGLDESIAYLVKQRGSNFEKVREELLATFEKDVVGCAAFVLKPSFLGLEISMRLARFAMLELGIGAVFSSTFDSGIGLAYASFLAAVSDASSPCVHPAFAHGLGTYTLLAGDTLNPSFGTYVNEHGLLHVSSLSRALFGLGLDEMGGSLVTPPPNSESLRNEEYTRDYESFAASGVRRREVRLIASLPLPFSDEIACSRFTDLPQQSRWSPWLTSVAYVADGSESEWKLNVRGIQFSWRAVSELLDSPYRGIRWESVSGLKNVGIVEFIPISEVSCSMRVRMTIVAPTVLAFLFRGASGFLEEFLQNKLLKWSLEMFRDVVKGDLALERGDVELGDALFGAVEGRANAIEATLSYRTDQQQ